MNPFIPLPNATKNIALSGSSQSVDLSLPAGYSEQVEVANMGTETAFVAFGKSTITTTTTTGYPVGAGCILTLTLTAMSTKPYAAAISSGAVGTIYFTPGSGA